MEILIFFEKLRTPFLTNLFSFITHFGEEYAFLILSLAILWCVNKRYGYSLLFCGIVGQTVNQFLKYTCAVERPWVAFDELSPVSSAIENASGYSFPSGHTQIASTTYGTLAYFYRKKKLLSISLTVLTLLVGISRLYLGVHYFSDVVFSLLFGGLVVVITCKSFDKGINTNCYRIITITLSLLLLIYTLLTVDVSLANENEYFALEFSSKFFGASLAFVLSWLIDEKYIRYTTKGKMGFQLFKLLIGAGIVILLRTLLKKLFLVFTLNQTMADGIRYFVLVMFAGCVWPYFFNKLYQKRSSKSTNC